MKNKTSVSYRWIQFGFGLSLFIAAMSEASAFAGEAMNTLQTREVLNQVLMFYRPEASPSGAPAPVQPGLSSEQIVQVLKSYRFNPASFSLETLLSGGTDGNHMTMANAPYPDILLNLGMQTIYSFAFKKQHDEIYDEKIAHLNVVTLFDGFMSAIRSNGLPDSLKDKGSEIGSCLAGRALEADPKECKLDTSETVDSPATTKLIWAKLTCGFLMSDCGVRTMIFEAAKTDLFEALKKPEIVKMVADTFEKLFPEEFRKGFLKQLNDRRANITQLITQKFGGTVVRQYWSPEAPLIESDGGSEDPSQVTLKGMATGLQVDLRASEMLATENQDPSLVAPLFYAAANRLLMMTGSNAVKFQDGHFVGPSDSDDDFRKPPRLLTQRVGGWGALKNSRGGVEYQPWDWANYDPSAQPSPSPLQIFPTTMHLNAMGVPKTSAGNAVEPSETMADLAELAEGLAEFLRMSRPQAAFGKYFVPTAQMDQMIDDTKPALFPAEGRMLGFGILSGILKNLMLQARGHLEIDSNVRPGANLGLVFHDPITLDGRVPGNAPIRLVGHMLVAAAHLRQILPGDPALKPEEIAAMIPKVDSALQIGALTLGAQGQETDGGFREKIQEPQRDNRRLIDTVAGMRAFTAAYSSSGMPVMLLNMKAGWAFLDHLWARGIVPQAIDGNAEALNQPQDLWELMNLWRETQGTVRQALGHDVDWTVWETRFNDLRRVLEDQIKSTGGPQAISHL